MRATRQRRESLFFRRILLVPVVALAACSSSRTNQLGDASASEGADLQSGDAGTAEHADIQSGDASAAADADAAYVDQPCAQRGEATCTANAGCFAIRGIPFVELCQGRQAPIFAGCVPGGPDA